MNLSECKYVLGKGKWLPLPAPNIPGMDMDSQLCCLSLTAILDVILAELSSVLSGILKRGRVTVWATDSIGAAVMREMI